MDCRANNRDPGPQADWDLIVLPHEIDQVFWGKRLVAIGAGLAPVGIRKLSVEVLVRSIRKAQDPGLSARAAELGRQVQAEDGVGAAVRLIEEHAIKINSLKP